MSVCPLGVPFSSNLAPSSSAPNSRSEDQLLLGQNKTFSPVPALAFVAYVSTLYLDLCLQEACYFSRWLGCADCTLSGSL